MKQFDVLSRHENMHGSRLLEASAGTGKTHSIENIVVRLLIDTETPIQLESMLVVTFTKAATEDLKIRVRENIFKAAELCREWIATNEQTAAPDYLIALFEQGEAAVTRAHRRLDQALIFFDRAQIFTIHSFCQRMLMEFLFEGNFPVASREIATSEIRHLVFDFFRTDLKDTLVTPEQLQRILTHCKGIDPLVKKLLTLAMGGADIGVDFPLHMQLEQFFSAIKNLKCSLNLASDKILEDFLLLAPAYKEICDVKKIPKADNVAKAKTFASLFDKDQWDINDFDALMRDGIYFLDVFNPDNRDKRRSLPEQELLHYPTLVPALEESLGKVISKARRPERILAILAAQCRQQIKTFFKQEEILNFDDILDSMEKALQNPQFASKVQKRFSVAIIDEFQDTDPLQWNIFKSLFLSYKDCHLYLVGDPKQSIYAFRQADIYTYLEAAEMLGKDMQATLAVNYRSTTAMVEALNHLFAETMLPGLMVLPRQEKTLPYRPVQSSERIVDKLFADGRKAVNFCAIPDVEKKSLSELEEEYYFPFIAQEIINMQSSQLISYAGFAILVSDRFQAERIGDYLLKHEIPFRAQRNKSLLSSEAFIGLREVLTSILNPKDESSLKLCLGGPIFRWKEPLLLEIDLENKRTAIISAFNDLRKIWNQKGLYQCMQEIMNFKQFITSGDTVIESLLATNGGEDFYRTLMQIIAFVAEEENHRHLQPHQVVDYFGELETIQDDDVEGSTAVSDTSKDAVSIMTIHSSKGLEFDVVFALGLIKRGKRPDLLVPVPMDGKRAELQVVDTEDDERYVAFKDELEAEKLRHLYVAWTRAKQRLYIPVDGEAAPRRSDSPSAMELYFQALKIHAPLEPESMIDRLLGGSVASHSDTSDVLISDKYSIAYIYMQNRKDVLKAASDAISPVLHKPMVPQVACKLLLASSFTSLNTRSENRSHKEYLDLSPPHDFEVLEKNSHNIPAGAEIGILLHSILEVIPFSFFSDQHQLRAFIERFTQSTPFASWTDVVYNIIRNAWKSKLQPVGENSFSLLDVAEWNTYREHEFMYPSSAIADVSVPEGYIKGIIDMIFRYNDKYYIIDWKGNWLGPDSNAYTQEALYRSMHECGYILQAKLYKEALKRFLSVCDNRTFESLFGGIFYVFLRGTAEDASSGIFICSD